jgi:hypothetical protein
MAKYGKLGEVNPVVTPLGIAVLADLPLALAVDLQPGAVEDQVRWTPLAK